jgi:hypothetical protein
MPLQGEEPPPARLETQWRDRIPAGLPPGYLDRAAPSDPGKNIANAEKTTIPLLSPFRALQLGVWWRGSELESRSARSELEIVGRLNKGQLGSAGGLVEE